MQIRLGNRQDEKYIVALVEQMTDECQPPQATQRPPLDDLHNIDANYVGKDGLFLVCEQNSKLIGVAGARRKTELALELTRIAVAKEHRKSGIARQFLSTIFSFAAAQEYKQVVLEPRMCNYFPDSQNFWKHIGFVSSTDKNGLDIWIYTIA